MSIKFTVSDFLPASPRAVYEAWLDSRAHSAMTGAKATASTKVGGQVSSWNGYASGVNLELVPGKQVHYAVKATEVQIYPAR